MDVDPHAEIRGLRTALRDLVALSAIPAAWVGREPSAIAAGLADVLVGSLHLDFAFVRLCDPNGGAAVEVTAGNAWKAFPEWLQHHLAVAGECSRKEVIPDVGGGVEPCRGIVIPVGVSAEGGLVAAACNRPDFPTEIDQLLLSVAANHAATAFQNARLIYERKRAEAELRQARDELELRVGERTAELRRSEAYLAEAQRLTHTGSWAWNIATGETIHASEEDARLFGFHPEEGMPSFEAFRQRIHPEDRARADEILDGAIRKRANFEWVDPEGREADRAGHSHVPTPACAIQPRARDRDGHHRAQADRRIPTPGAGGARARHSRDDPGRVDRVDRSRDQPAAGRHRGRRQRVPQLVGGRPSRPRRSPRCAGRHRAGGPPGGGRDPAHPPARFEDRATQSAAGRQPRHLRRGPAGAHRGAQPSGVVAGGPGVGVGPRPR